MFIEKSSVREEKKNGYNLLDKLAMGCEEDSPETCG